MLEFEHLLGQLDLESKSDLVTVKPYCFYCNRPLRLTAMLDYVSEYGVSLTEAVRDQSNECRHIKEGY